MCLSSIIWYLNTKHILSYSEAEFDDFDEFYSNYEEQVNNDKLYWDWLGDDTAPETKEFSATKYSNPFKYLIKKPYIKTVTLNRTECIKRLKSL